MGDGGESSDREINCLSFSDFDVGDVDGVFIDVVGCPYIYSMLSSWTYNWFSSTPKSPVTHTLLRGRSFVVRASRCV